MVRWSLERWARVAVVVKVAVRTAGLHLKGR